MSGQRPSATEVHRRLVAAGPWYHDFRRLGLDTAAADRRGPAALLRRLAGAVRARLGGGPKLEKGGRLLSRATLWPAASHRRNQRHKEEILLPWLTELLGEPGPGAACLDLFCADGYYSCTMASQRPDLAITGVDLDAAELARARLAGELLGLGNLRFERAEAESWVRTAPRPYGLVLCAGGLYHLDDPLPLLAALRQACRGPLIVQSAVSLARQEPDYFEAPAPGWRHGCRFSHAWLEDRLAELGWRLERQARNVLTGNRRPADRGSSYFVCRPDWAAPAVRQG